MKDSNAENWKWAVALSGLLAVSGEKAMAASNTYGFFWSGTYYGDAFFAEGTLDIVDVGNGQQFFFGDIDAMEITVRGPEFFTPFSFDAWNPDVTGTVSGDGRTAVFEPFSGPASTNGDGFFGCYARDCGTLAAPAFTVPPSEYQLYLNDGYFMEAYFGYEDAGTAVRSMKMTLQETPVPEIDATAGLGSLAALGAVLAFVRGRRRAV